MTRAAELRDHVYQLLDQAGHTADLVADRFRALGIRGKRGSECACPLANYLFAANLPGLDNITVDADSVTIWLDHTHDGPPIDVELPNACAVFVDRFDKGVYLDLETVPA